MAFPTPTAAGAARLVVRALSPRVPAPAPSRAPCCRRAFSIGTPAVLARSTAYRPKRDATYYGQHVDAHPQPDPAQRPRRGETDTSNHPLWRFFHDQQSLEVPDKRKDNSSQSTAIRATLRATN